MHTQDLYERGTQPSGPTIEKTKPNHEGGGQERSEKVVGYRDHLPYLRQQMGEPSVVCSQEKGDDSHHQ